MSFIPVPILDATLEVNLKVNSHLVKLVKQLQTFVNKWYRTFCSCNLVLFSIIESSWNFGAPAFMVTKPSAGIKD